MAYDHLPRSIEAQRSPETPLPSSPGVEARIGMQRGRTSVRAKLAGAGVVLGALLLGILMVKLFPEFAVSKVIYAMVGK